MSVNPLLDYFNNSVVNPLVKRGEEAHCAAKALRKRVYRLSSAVFSGIGNWPFYGVASSFGSRYSSAFGRLLGGCEFASYFTFRLRNFEEIRQKFFGGGSENEATVPASRASLRDSEDPRSSPQSVYPATPSTLASEEERQPLYFGSSSSSEKVRATPASNRYNWKSIAMKTGIAALGLIAQFPIMVLVYYGNGESLVYPAITGVCEASFTILSLLMSFKASKKKGAGGELDSGLYRAQEGLTCYDRAKQSPIDSNDEHHSRFGKGKEENRLGETERGIESGRKLIVRQINRFLEELPSKYNDPDFINKIEKIFSDSPQKTEDQRGRELLSLVFGATGLPELKEGSWDETLKSLAKGLGYFISLYLTTVNGAVSYKGVKTWRSNQEALAILTTIFVSLANIKLLNKVCVDSATSYYEGLRDIIKNQFRPPLAHAVSPIAWYVGRAISTVTSWFSFGTTAIGARDYIPKAGNALIAPAPLSSALLLNDNMNWSFDDLLLWAKSKCDSKAAKFNHINTSLKNFREVIENSDPQVLQRFLDQLPHLRKPVPPTSSDEASTPLLMKHVVQSD